MPAAGARSRHAIKGPSAVHDEGSRGALVSVRAGLGPARGRDAVTLCRRHGRVAPVAVRSTRRAEAVLGLCDRDGVDAPPCRPVALAPRGRLLAVGLVVAGCRSRRPRPPHALPTQSVSRGCMPPPPIERTPPSPRRQHGPVDGGRRRMGGGEPRWTRPLASTSWRRSMMRSHGCPLTQPTRRARATKRRGGALLHESSRARTLPTDRFLACRCDMTRVGRGRSSDSGSHSPRTASLPCPDGLRAQRPSPMMDVSRKNVCSPPGSDDGTLTPTSSDAGRAAAPP